MFNWLGQDIVPGVYVYRGAREGNYSSFKMGRVRKVNEDKQKVTVDWLAQPESLWLVDDNNVDIVVDTIGKPRWAKSGTSDINTMVVIDSATAERAIAYSEIVAEARTVLTRHQSSRVSNPQFAGYPLKRDFDEFVRHELVERGLAV